MGERVYVVNHGGHDITPFREVVPKADVIFLTEGNVNVFSLGRLCEQMRMKMAGSGPDDYILLCGFIILNVVAVGIQLAKHGRVNLLLWQARDRTYTTRELTDSMLTGEGL